MKALLRLFCCRSRIELWLQKRRFYVKKQILYEIVFVNEGSKEHTWEQSEVFLNSVKVNKTFGGSKYALSWYEKLHKLEKQCSVKILKNNLSPEMIAKVTVIIPVYNVELYLKECLGQIPIKRSGRSASAVRPFFRSVILARQATD